MILQLLHYKITHELILTFLAIPQQQFFSFSSPFITAYLCIYNTMNNLSDLKSHFIVLDIGGTLSKVCFITDESIIPHDSKLTIKLANRTLYFNYFKIVEECFDFLITHFHADDKFSSLVMTGGGSYKYSQQLGKISKEKKMSLVLVQQFESIVKGLSFFRNFSLIQQFKQSYISQSGGVDKYQNRLTTFSSFEESPIMVVNIGSGVSILVIQKNQKGQLKAQRVGGTSLGGGFFMGIAQLLTGQGNFNKLLQMAQQGNVKHTDFTPQDFPEVLQQLNEASVLVSLGKLNKDSNIKDIVRSLFYMVTFNIAQIALSYSQVTNVRHVLFTGFYCRGNNFFLQCFTEAFNFFNKKSSPRFVYSMVHDGFLGAIGALLIELENLKDL